MRKLYILVVITLLLSFAGCKEEPNNMVGAWKIAEIHSGDVLITDQSVPSIFVFTPGHYSMLWVLSTKPPQPFVERWNPTDDEKIKRFNSLIVNSGTYEIEGSTITMYPLVARIPELMGGKQIAEYRVENDTMHLKFVDEYSFDGVQAPWVAAGGITLTLSRIE